MKTMPPTKINAEELRKLLCKYFESHSDGTPSETFDEYFEPSAFIDAVAELVEEW